MISQLLQCLRRLYPSATYELNWQTPEQMLVAAILAAQSTDQKINQVTATLFQDYPDPQAFADADPAILEQQLKPTGFYRRKTQTVQTVCRALVDRFQGQVPRTMEELTSIPGIARKTANVVLNCCFDLPTGIIVDTHVIRLSQRLGLSTHKQPERIEQDLIKQIPQSDWTWFGPALILHGRQICQAKSPKCKACILLEICPRHGLDTPKPDPEERQTELSLELSTSLPSSTSSAPTQKTWKEPIDQPIDQPIDKSGDDLQIQIPPGLEAWGPLLSQEIAKPYFQDLLAFVAQSRETDTIFPPEDEMFTAFALTPPDQVRVLILGQDPYHDQGQAHGLSFSVKRGNKLPPSLKNMLTELRSDLAIPLATHGDLSTWAQQGVMLLNTVLTVQAHQPNSHRNKGWETFTDTVIRIIAQNQPHVVFVLWGAAARKKAKLIDPNRHTILESVHPSPLSARSGFFGSQPYSKVNAALQQTGQTPIDWRLPD